MKGEETAFRTPRPIIVPPRRMTPLALTPDGEPLKGVVSTGDGVGFETVGWYDTADLRIRELSDG